MLQEMKIEDALKKFLQGKKVLVMYDETLGADKPEFTVEPLEEILKRNRFLVDVPAIENPDFKQAVEKMVKPKKTSTKTTKKKLANPPHNKSKLDEREDEIIQMLKDGKSQREIAQDLGVTPSTISYWMSRHGIDKSGIRKKCSTCLYRDKNPKKETVIISAKRDTVGTAALRIVTSIWRISVKKLYQVKTVQGKIVEEGALLEDIAQKLGSSTEKLHAAMSQGYAVYGLYILVPVDFALSKRDKMLLVDFDHTRKELLAAGRKE